MALQRAWLAQKRNDFQLPGEFLPGGEYGHSMLVKPEESDGPISRLQGPFSGRDFWSLRGNAELRTLPNENNRPAAATAVETSQQQVRRVTAARLCLR